MPPRPTSPTSLLWAHELKKQHAHLLKRVDALSTSTDDVEKATKSMEETIRAWDGVSEDVNSLLTRVDALEDLQKKLAIRLDGFETKQQLESEEQNGAIQTERTKVEAVDALAKSANKELKGVKEAQVSFNARIDQLVAFYQELNGSSGAFVRKNDPNNVTNLARRLDAFEEKRKMDVEQTRGLHERVGDLEKANRDLSYQNRELEYEIFRLKGGYNAVNATPSVPPESLPASPHMQVPCSPLAHKSLNQAKRKLQDLDSPAEQAAYRRVYRRHSRRYSQPSDREAVEHSLASIQDAQRATYPETQFDGEQASVAAYSRKKRKSCQMPTTRQTRSQARVAQSDFVKRSRMRNVLQNTAALATPRFQTLPIHVQNIRQFAEKHQQKPKRRREIPQLVDDATFAADIEQSQSI